MNEVFDRARLVAISAGAELKKHRMSSGLEGVAGGNSWAVERSGELGGGGGRRGGHAEEREDFVGMRMASPVPPHTTTPQTSSTGSASEEEVATSQATTAAAYYLLTPRLVMSATDGWVQPRGEPAPIYSQSAWRAGHDGDRLGVVTDEAVAGSGQEAVRRLEAPRRQLLAEAAARRLATGDRARDGRIHAVVTANEEEEVAGSGAAAATEEEVAGSSTAPCAAVDLVVGMRVAADLAVVRHGGHRPHGSDNSRPPYVRRRRRWQRRRPPEVRRQRIWRWGGMAAADPAPVMATATTRRVAATTYRSPGATSGDKRSVSGFGWAGGARTRPRRRDSAAKASGTAEKSGNSFVPRSTSCSCAAARPSSRRRSDASDFFRRPVVDDDDDVPASSSSSAAAAAADCALPASSRPLSRRWWWWWLLSGGAMSRDARNRSKRMRVAR
uniref:Uncharacterized protein n=1 Tax=Oryza punctata TaxID=4537 RepID=A0A0E0JZ00_ORYPU